MDLVSAEYSPTLMYTQRGVYNLKMNLTPLRKKLRKVTLVPDVIQASQTAFFPTPTKQYVLYICALRFLTHFPLQMMKTDILFSSPRLRFSRAQQEAVLDWGKALGARDVPSLYALGKFQEESKKALGDPTTKVTTASGNVLYMNDPVSLLAKVSSPTT